MKAAKRMSCGSLLPGRLVVRYLPKHRAKDSEVKHMKRHPSTFPKPCFLDLPSPRNVKRHWVLVKEAGRNPLYICTIATWVDLNPCSGPEPQAAKQTKHHASPHKTQEQ